MRIVVATFGSLGDLHPVLALGAELHRRGHHTGIVTSEFHRERVTTAGLKFYPAAPDLRPDDEDLIRATMDEVNGPKEVVNFMVRHLPQTYADYERAVAAHGGADVFITSDLAWAGIALAQKTGLRWASLVLSPVSFMSPYDECVIAGAPWISRLHSLGPHAYGILIAGVKALARQLGRPLNDFRAGLGLPRLRNPFFDDKNSPELVLAMFSPLIGERRPDWPASTVVTGYAFWDRDEPTMTADLEPFLDAGEPPVVFTLGSAAVFDPGDFFVESYKAIKAVGRRAVMLVGMQSGRMPPPDPAIGVFPYEPFSRLFPRSAAVVHQGGSGTMGQVMRAGKPMLVVPYAHDQADNAFRATKLGIARSVRRKAYRGDRVAAALQQLLDDTSVARRAREIGAVVSQEHGAVVAADAIERTFSSTRQ